MAKDKAPARTPATKTSNGKKGGASKSSKSSKSSNAAKPRRDLYQEVTDAILGMLDAGTVPWHNPVRGAGGGELPRNLASGRKYRGVNVFLLVMTGMSRGFDSPWWVTFKQALGRGGNVRKGEKGTPVIFWKKLVGDDEEVEIDPATGRPTKAPMVLRAYTVFNAAAQCEGLDVPAPVDLAGVPAFVRLEEAERIVREYPRPQPTIEHQGTLASYIPSQDVVRLPPPERFGTPEEYYSTAFHELVHSTGIKGRCDRGLGTAPAPFGTSDYGKEELVAEMGAAFLNAAAGIFPQTARASASYIDGWRRTIKGDKKLVVQAAAQAQRAADFILGTTFEAANDDDPEPSTTPQKPTERPQEAGELPEAPGPAQPAEEAPRAAPGEQGTIRTSDNPAAWDFQTTFPPPLPKAVGEGVVSADDAAGENLAALTLGHLTDCRRAFDFTRKLLDAAERGVSPETGKKPRTAATRGRLVEATARRIGAARRRYESLVAGYADAFGIEAAAAFQARVEGVAVEDLVPTQPPEATAWAQQPQPPQQPRPDRTSGPQLTLF
jgi:antirestriction protein ArdC